MFVGRENELGRLRELLDEPLPQLLRLLGRRRVGKTELLLHLLEERRGLYLYSPELEALPLREDLARQVTQRIKAEPRAVPSWGDLFDLLEETGYPLVVLDEFQHALQSDKSLESRLQDRWDRGWKRTGPSVILCGSSVGMMQRLTDRRGAPLYGRLTGELRLRPMSYAEARSFHPSLPEEERVRRYAVFGGTPLYQEACVGKRLPDALRSSFFVPGARFLDEPERLLKEECRDPARYETLLTAIGEGARILPEIESKAHLSGAGTAYYLRSLVEDMDLVRAEQPTLGRQRLAHYALSDPFFEFYYRFVAPQRALIEAHRGDEALERTEKELEGHVGRVFERVVREVLSSQRTIAGIPRPPLREIGSWWNRRGEAIDLVLSTDTEVWFGEVKWSSSPQTEALVHALLDKIGRVERLGSRKWRPFVVARGGVTPKAEGLLRDHAGFGMDLQGLVKMWGPVSGADEGRAR